MGWICGLRVTAKLVSTYTSNQGRRNRLDVGHVDAFTRGSLDGDRRVARAFLMLTLPIAHLAQVGQADSGGEEEEEEGKRERGKEGKLNRR